MSRSGNVISLRFASVSRSTTVGGSGNYETATGNDEMRTSGSNLSYFGNVASSFV